MSRDKFSYLDPMQLLRFPFTRTSIQWGVTIGALLACHKYSRTRTSYLGIWQQALLSGFVTGLIVGSGTWAYYMFQFTKESHVLRRQTQMKQENARKEEYLKRYFRERYGLME